MLTNLSNSVTIKFQNRLQLIQERIPSLCSTICSCRAWVCNVQCYNFIAPRSRGKREPINCWKGRSSKQNVFFVSPKHWKHYQHEALWRDRRRRFQTNKHLSWKPGTTVLLILGNSCRKKMYRLRFSQISQNGENIRVEINCNRKCVVQQEVVFSVWSLECFGRWTYEKDRKGSDFWCHSSTRSEMFGFTYFCEFL